MSAARAASAAAASLPRYLAGHDRRLIDVWAGSLLRCVCCSFTPAIFLASPRRHILCFLIVAAERQRRRRRTIGRREELRRKRTRGGEEGRWSDGGRVRGRRGGGGVSPIIGQGKPGGRERGRGERFHATLTTLAPSSFPMPMEYGSASLPRQLGSGMMGGRG